METPLWHYKFGEEDIALLRKLNEADVSYLIIGGAAVAHYGCREAHEIDDLDILVDNSEVNAQRFADVINRATTEAGRSLKTPLTSSNFIKPRVQFPLKFSPFNCEFQTSVSHEDFEALLLKAVKSEIRFQKILLVSLSDLIEMKKKCVEEYGAALKKHADDLKKLMNLVP